MLDIINTLNDSKYLYILVILSHSLKNALKSDYPVVVTLYFIQSPNYLFHKRKNYNYNLFRCFSRIIQGSLRTPDKVVPNKNVADRRHREGFRNDVRRRRVMPVNSADNLQFIVRRDTE